MLPNYDQEATGIKMKKKKSADLAIGAFRDFEKHKLARGQGSQGPRGNRTQVRKAGVTATAQLVP